MASKGIFQIQIKIEKSAEIRDKNAPDQYSSFEIAEIRVFFAPDGAHATRLKREKVVTNTQVNDTPVIL